MKVGSHELPGLPGKCGVGVQTEVQTEEIHWSLVAYWAPRSLGRWSFSVISFCLFILLMGSQGKKTEVICHSLLQWTTFCQKSPLWPICLEVLPREGTGHSKHPFPKTQETTLHMDITRLSILNKYWSYPLQPKMETLYTVTKNKTVSWLRFRSWTFYCQIQT